MIQGICFGRPGCNMGLGNTVLEKNGLGSPVWLTDRNIGLGRPVTNYVSESLISSICLGQKCQLVGLISVCALVDQMNLCVLVGLSEICALMGLMEICALVA
jgi:hypothetical protein